VALGARGSEIRVRVAAVLPVGDGLVLVRHRRGAHDYHLLPGGGVEFGESMGEAVVREVLEETGIACVPERPLFINDSIDPSGARHVVNVTFLARPTDVPDELSSTDPRVVGIDIVELDRLRSLDLRPPMASQLVDAAHDSYQRPAAYLGPLWVEERGITGADRSARTDG
jgi:8-oxo-dGTP pyrophosphatase MutT (NUDIX family)